MRLADLFALSSTHDLYYSHAGLPVVQSVTLDGAASIAGMTRRSSSPSICTREGFIFACEGLLDRTDRVGSYSTRRVASSEKAEVWYLWSLSPDSSSRPRR